MARKLKDVIRFLVFIHITFATYSYKFALRTAEVNDLMDTADILTLWTCPVCC
ncbi:unnamed protein product, partial [Nesidiocoris tenuis]